VYIPIYLCAPVQVGVDPREEVGGDHRGDDGLYELVEEEGCDEFVDVEGEGGE